MRQADVADLSPPAVAARPRVGVALLVLLGALIACGPLSIDMYLPALPQIGRSLHSTAGAVQLTLTASVVGLGLGQLIAGPLSDTLGRRTPLLGGLVVFTAFSIGCAVAPTLPVLIACRFGQALGGSAGIVISRAIARDLRSGLELARLFALLQLINGAAPVAAPIIGGQLVRFTSWRGVFVVLAAIGLILAVGAAILAPDSLPAQRRRRGGVRSAFAVYAGLARNLSFMTYVVAGALAFAALFTYISNSPFILEVRFGLSPQQFSLVFGSNAVVLVGASQLRFRTPVRALGVGLPAMLVGAVTVCTAILGGLGLPVLLPGFGLIAAGFGLVAPNVTALALAGHPEVAGSASAVFGASQFLLGGVLAPLAGLGGHLITVGVVEVAVTVSALVAAAVAVSRPPGWRRSRGRGSSPAP